MKYYNNPPTLVTLEGDCEEMGVFPGLIARGLRKARKRILSRIKKRIQRKKKRRSKQKFKTEQKRQQVSRKQQIAFHKQQRMIIDQGKNRKQKQLLTIAIPAGIAAMMLLGEDK